jgi:membrane associated rhomboid family serine protease
MKIKTNSVIMPIVIVNIIVFILQIAINGFSDLFILDPSQLITRPYMIFTSMFLHGSINHIFWNMYGLMMFGPLLEQKIGSKRFLFIYLLSGVLASIGHVVLSIFIFGNALPALGASGAIMGMLGVLIILMPDLKLLFMFFIPMSLRTAGIVWAILDILGVIGIGKSGIGNLAHLTGMVSGLLYGFYLKKKKSKFNKKFQTKSHITAEDLKEYMKTGKI